MILSSVLKRLTAFSDLGHSLSSCRCVLSMYAGLSTKSNDTSARDRASYKWFLPFQTRWLDNDRYGHVNNAVYHAIFDSVINIFLIRHCGLDVSLSRSDRVGFMVTNECQFYAPASYPQVKVLSIPLLTKLHGFSTLPGLLGGTVPPPSGSHQPLLSAWNVRTV